MKLYQKLQERDLVENHKDFAELVWLRAIRVNDSIVNDPNLEVKDDDKVKVGILSVD